MTAAVVSGTLCIGLTMSMMNLAIPLMISALHTDIETIQWIITGPMLVNIALVPLVSSLTALVGIRTVYLWALAIWVATSLPSGLSNTAAGVILFRLLQGVGGSLYIPTVITIMYRAFPPNQRGLALGIQQGAHWVAPAIGMTLGGYLLQWQGWPAVFFYPIPIGIVSLGVALRVLPNVRVGTRDPIDLGGLATLTPALTLLLLTVSQSQRPGWERMHVLTLLGGVAICTVAFILVERWHTTPLLDFELLREPAFGAASTVCFLNTFAGMGISFAVIIFLQEIWGYSPLQVGFLLLPATLGRIAGEVAAGHLSDRWGARGISSVGLAIFAVSCGALGQLDTQASALLICVLLVLGNTGMALSNSPIIHAGLRALRDERMSMGSGLLSLVRIVAGTFGVGVVGPLVTWGEQWRSVPPTASLPAALAERASLLPGYQMYFYIMAALILVALIPTLLIRPSMRRMA